MRRRQAFSLFVLALSALALAQPRAFREINFGESAAVVAEKIANDSAFTSPMGGPVSMYYPPEVFQNYINAPGATIVDTSVGGKTYHLIFDFHDDQLYRIQFQSEPDSAQYLDTRIEGLKNNLVTVITKAHGEPDRHQDVAILDLRAGHITWSDVWIAEIGGVGYKVGLGETNNMFYAAMWVEYAAIADRMTEVDQQEQNDAQQKSSQDF